MTVSGSKVLIYSAVILAFCASLEATEQQGQMLHVKVSDISDGIIVNATGKLLSAERVVQAMANSSGEILFKNVPEGTYRLEVSSPGFAKTTLKEVRVAQGKSKPTEVILKVASTLDNCRFVNTVEYGPLRPGAALSGRVINTDNSRAVAKAWVDLLPADQDDPVTSTRSDKNGRFHFATLQPGRYIARVSKDPYWPSSLDSFFVAQENTTTLVMGLDKRGHMHMCQ